MRAREPSRVGQKPLGLGEFEYELAPDLLGGARFVYVGSLIQSQFAIARDIPFGSALSFALSVGVLLVLGALRRPLSRAGAAP